MYRSPKGNRGLFHDTLKAQLQNLNSEGQDFGPWKHQQKFSTI